MPWPGPRLSSARHRCLILALLPRLDLLCAFSVAEGERAVPGLYGSYQVFQMEHLTLRPPNVTDAEILRCGDSGCGLG